MYLVIYVLAGVLLVQNSHAWDLFRNKEQKAAVALQEQDYATAAELFTDNYRRGIALYRAGRYAEAANAFAQVEREDVQTSAWYNLGNAHFQQQQYAEAVEAYQRALQLRDDADIRHNLALALQALENEEKEKEKEKEEEEKEEKQSEDGEPEESKPENGEPENGESEESEPEETENSQSENPKPEDSKLEELENSEENSQEQQDIPDIQDINEQLDKLADFWLSKIHTDPSQLLKNQFYLDLKRKYEGNHD